MVYLSTILRSTEKQKRKFYFEERFVIFRNMFPQAFATYLAKICPLAKLNQQNLQTHL